MQGELRPVACRLLRAAGWNKAFSSEVGTGSREENASKQRLEPRF
jgi:hypothetical protein